MKSKRIFIAVLSALILLGATSCRKQCHCYGYDGSHTYFTKEEVKESKGNCSEMIIWNDIRLYSICEWD
ncbi:MAG: hypothetical protein KBT45_06100 [Bacteroidales bacterium]|nr:hypothetical protein [Candidatus Colimorpha pelethequi]